MDKEQAMAKTKTTRYDVAEHLRTPEEMAAYLEACFEEADSDAAFITKALGDIARATDMSQLARNADEGKIGRARPKISCPEILDNCRGSQEENNCSEIPNCSKEKVVE